MGSLVACSGSDSELAELREELENVKEQLEDSLEPEETSEQVLVESEQQLEIEKSENESITKSLKLEISEIKPSQRLQSISCAINLSCKLEPSLISN